MQSNQFQEGCEDCSGKSTDERCRDWTIVVHSESTYVLNLDLDLAPQRIRLMNGFCQLQVVLKTLIKSSRVNCAPCLPSWSALAQEHPLLLRCQSERRQEVTPDWMIIRLAQKHLPPEYSRYFQRSTVCWLGVFHLSWLSLLGLCWLGQATSTIRPLVLPPTFKSLRACLPCRDVLKQCANTSCMKLTNKAVPPSNSAKAWVA